MFQNEVYGENNEDTVKLCNVNKELNDLKEVEIKLNKIIDDWKLNYK